LFEVYKWRRPIRKSFSPVQKNKIFCCHELKYAKMNIYFNSYIQYSPKYCNYTHLCRKHETTQSRTSRWYTSNQWSDRRCSLILSYYIHMPFNLLMKCSFISISVDISTFPTPSDPLQLPSYLTEECNGLSDIILPIFEDYVSVVPSLE